MTYLRVSLLFMFIAEGLMDSRDNDLMAIAVLERLEESTKPEGPMMSDHIAIKVFLARILQWSGNTHEARKRCVPHESHSTYSQTLTTP